jgi:hypothetical protein
MIAPLGEDDIQIAKIIANLAAAAETEPASRTWKQLIAIRCRPFSWI